MGECCWGVVVFVVCECVCLLTAVVLKIYGSHRFGTGLGSGCTSGHGVAGLTRLSKRSIFAVATFFAANIAVTTLLHTVGIGTGWKLAMEGSG